MSKEANLEWLQKRVQEYRSTKNDIGETVEDFDEVEKLGQGFTSVDPLEEVDIGDGTKPMPTFVNKNMRANYKVKVIELLKEYVDCFAWESIMRCRVLAVSSLSIGFQLNRVLGLINSHLVVLILYYMTESKKRLIGC